MKLVIASILPAVLLSGCVAVPIDEPYPVRSSVHVYDAPYPVYPVYEVPRPVYGPPVYVGPPVYGPRYGSRDWHPGYRGHGPAPSPHHHSGVRPHGPSSQPAPHPHPNPHGDAHPRRGRGSASGPGAPGYRPGVSEGHGGRGALRQ